MKTGLRLILRLHTALVGLYPPGFRRSFGGEMQAVFSQTALEAAEQGFLALGWIFLREVRDLPLTALGEHRHERRNRVAATLQASGGNALSTKWEILMALAAFLVPAGYIFFNATPRSLVGQLVPPVLLVLLLAGSVIGLVKRFPRWSLSYIGLVLSAIVFLYLFHWEAKRIGTFLASRFVVQPNDELGRLLLATFWEGVVWLSLLVLGALTILLLALMPRFRSLRKHLREDWTQLSYLIYNGSMLALVLAFDEYRYAEPYALAALLCLAAGAWGYLRSRRPAYGFLALLVGATLSMWVAAMGMWLLVPRQEWTVWFRWHPAESERWFEAGRALIGWVWMVVVLALPYLWQLLWRTRGSRSSA